MAVVVAIGWGIFWRLQILRANREHLALTELTTKMEETIGARTHEVEERKAALEKEIEECRRHEDELRLADAVFESAAEAIFVTDVDNNIVRVNPAFSAITGYTQAEVIGKNPRLLKSGRHGVAFYEEMWRAIEKCGNWEGEIWNRHKSGNILVEWLSIARLNNRLGAARHLAIFHDITRRKEAEDLLRYRASHDALTDLPNRELFNDRLQAAFNQAKRYHRIFALLQVDLDRFKEVNDTLGHAAGDELLVEAAHRLVSCVRESDTVARLGGDEFAILLSEMAEPSEAEQIARRAVSLLNEPYHLDAGTAHISGCVGIALYPQHGEDCDELRRNADIALYAAKESGRNTYRIYASPQCGRQAQGELI